MKLDRRTTLKAIGVAGAVGGPAMARAMDTTLPPPVAVIYSSRLPESAAFGRSAPHGVLRVDTALRDLGQAWRLEIAATLAAGGGRIEGFGMWSDLLISQGMGREHGLRLVHEAVSTSADGRQKFFRWSLA